MTAMNITPLRRRVLEKLSVASMHGQDIGYEFASARRATLAKQVFKTPQMATRWAAAFMKPMVEAGLVHHAGCGQGGIYSLLGRGRAVLKRSRA